MMNTLDETAISLHELFSSFVKAGFTREESLELCKAMLPNGDTK